MSKHSKTDNQMGQIDREKEIRVAYFNHLKLTIKDRNLI